MHAACHSPPSFILTHQHDIAPLWSLASQLEETSQAKAVVTSSKNLSRTKHPICYNKKKITTTTCAEEQPSLPFRERQGRGGWRRHLVCFPLPIMIAVSWPVLSFGLLCGPILPFCISWRAVALAYPQWLILGFNTCYCLSS